MDDLIIGRAFGILYRRSQAVIISNCRKHDLSYGEYALLMNMAQAVPGELSQDDLSTSLCVDKAAVTRSLKSLEAKGLVRRERDEEDRRRNRLYVTENGQKLALQLQTMLHDWLAEITRGWRRKERDTVRDRLQDMAVAATAADIESFLARH